jgi:TctA family transporter
VIAPETANNSKEGGSLLPTLFFGIPGSSGMAIMLGAFVTLGLQPGPKMITEHLDLVWYLIWALVISNVLCVIFLIGCAPWVGRLAMMRASLLIPFVVVFSLLGSYFGARAWENLVLLLVFGGIGYLFKRHKWPRPPLVIGLVLGPIAEDSLHKAFAIWGPSFLLRPQCLVIIAMIVASIGVYLFRLRQPKVLYDL